MARPTKRRKLAPTTNSAPTRANRPDLRERLLADFAALKVPLTTAQLDAILARAERAGLSHLEFAQALIAEQAQQRRERAIARRIKEACFRDLYTLADFDWDFNASPFNMNPFNVSWGSVMDYIPFFVRGKDASPTQAAQARSAGKASCGPLVYGDSGDY
jgi:hypothetical protein